MILITLSAHAQRGYRCWVCVCVTLHFTSRMFVRLTNDTTYLTGNEGQNFVRVSLKMLRLYNITFIGCDHWCIGDDLGNDIQENMTITVV